MNRKQKLVLTVMLLVAAFQTAFIIPVKMGYMIPRENGWESLMDFGRGDSIDFERLLLVYLIIGIITTILYLWVGASKSKGE